jgi:hypothetical protein
VNVWAVTPLPSLVHPIYLHPPFPYTRYPLWPAQQTPARPTTHRNLCGMFSRFPVTPLLWPIHLVHPSSPFPYTRNPCQPAQHSRRTPVPHLRLHGSNPCGQAYERAQLRFLHSTKSIRYRTIPYTPHPASSRPATIPPICSLRNSETAGGTKTPSQDILVRRFFCTKLNWPVSPST